MKSKGGYGKTRSSGHHKPSKTQKENTGNDRNKRSKISSNDKSDRSKERENRFERSKTTSGSEKKRYKPERVAASKKKPDTGSFKSNEKPFRQKGQQGKFKRSTDDSEIRLNKFIANAGICSRREADNYIKSGAVTVNGKKITELGTKIKRSDTVNIEGQVIKPEKNVYLLLNKPKDFITTVDDPHATKTVMDLIRNACQERIYPVGRLDRNSTGVLLFTNDGELTKRLTHPKYMKQKIYHIWIDKNLQKTDMQKLVGGIELEDGVSHADAVSFPDETDKKQIGIEIHSGKNRVIRRMFEAIGYKVLKLDRVYFAGLTKKNLPRGKWRFLNQKEINMLKMNAFR